MLSLELEKVEKWFGNRKVLEKINLKLENPSSLAIIGPNGSGKTTLLKIICGLIRPTSGKVYLKWGGKEVPKENKKNFFSLVAPDLELYGELTALENLKFFSCLKDQENSKQDLIKKTEQVGLKGRENDLVSSYSSGMKQRLKYALATVGSPKIVLLDEPSSNLDQEGVFLMEKIMENQKKEGILILATNDLKETKYAQKTFKLGN